MASLRHPEPAPDPRPSSPLREEWVDAGWASRTLFVTGGLYWLAMVAFFVVTVPAARSLAEVGLVLGFYFVPLFYAVVLRGAYVLVTRSRRRPPRLVSWWLLVIGALVGILFTVARAAVPDVGA